MSSINDINLNLDSKYNLYVYKDRDLDRDIICEVYSGNTLLTTFDFTPYSGATMQVKIKATDTYSVLEFNTLDGSIELNPNGVLRLVKSASELLALCYSVTSCVIMEFNSR